MSELDKLQAAVTPLCLNCMERKAKAIRSTKMIFCTAACATSWAVRTAQEGQYVWCPRHEVWHAEVARKECEEEQALRNKDPRIPL